ncbi:ABC transporter ATP-binding protein [Colwellia sp. UCD-KL20]|uniref:ABC transporter ATP-binding protein n=1 Tax=Colwellia sp. UCD-KL20 TaxID=1917165 RepID=UPI000970DFE7|nr:ABC transporter ATP-binding protein [Colwellia sp. UCD-KL20]
MNTKAQKMNFFYFFSLLKQHKKGVLFVIILMVLESLVSLSVPWFAGQFSKSVLENYTIYDFGYKWIALIWLSLFAIQAVLRFFSTYRINYIGAQVLTQLSCRLYDHIQVLPVKYFNNNKKGETLALLSNDVSILSHFLSGVITSLVPSFLILVGALILMASISPTITFIIMLMVPAFFVVLKILGKGIKPLTEDIVQSQANSVAIASENFGVIKLVKAFSRENIESDRFKNNAYKIQELRRKQLKIQAILSPLVQLLVTSGVLVVVVVSAIHYQTGKLSMPDLITLLMYGILFARPMSALANLYGQTQQALGASTRLIKVFNISPEPIDKGELEQEIKSNSISFKNISFSYNSTDILLNNVNIDIAKSETLVIIGENGKGKTTILHLLMRFIEPTTGVITIGDTNINDINLSVLRKYIGFVSQDIALCDGSVMDNIAYGYPQATKEEIENVAIKAGAHTFINELEFGYKTQVGENGVLLSGGQRQRISLARALLAKPSILLLDEPTSMIDKEGKEDFNLQLATLLQDQTVIIVTHEQHLTEIADRVVTIENGQLVIIKN